MKSFRFGPLAVIAAVAMFTAIPTARADRLTIDTVHASALFWAHHFDAGYVVGLFSGVTGIVNTGDGASFDITIDTTTIETKNDKRNEDLKSADWFDVKQFPTMTFKSTAVKAAGDNKMEVTGDLTIHGVTKPVTVTVENTGTGKGPNGAARTGFLTEFKVNRADFGLAPKAPPQMIGEEVKISVALECVAG